MGQCQGEPRARLRARETRAKAKEKGAKARARDSKEHVLSVARWATSPGSAWIPIHFKELAVHAAIEVTLLRIVRIEESTASKKMTLRSREKTAT